ncbi:3-hydroxyacyl-CoA dehydrogenase family protein, partial [Nocardia salmonicida]
AYVSAKAGYDVVLKDVELANAVKGKGYAEAIEAKALSRGKTTQEKSDALLARITPTADAADFKGVDFVIEAVFENPDLKNKVFQEIEDIVDADALLGSNTSTLPITLLADGVKRSEDFIGIHFFSPVDKMPLVEIIKGEKTSDEALARVYDYTLAIKKTPIVVNDSRGFFTSRVIGTFINEAISMVAEGIDPATVEQAGLQAGYPAAPLKLSDELNFTTMQKIYKETSEAILAAGGELNAASAKTAEVLNTLIDKYDRKGKLGGAGFYEYIDGKATGLWDELREIFSSSRELPEGVTFQDLKDRMMFAESIETQKCFDEGVLTSTADANIGSIFGIGFPAWSGGSHQFIVGYPGGQEAFVARADELAAKFGPRFEVPASLRK